jgi:hypothetical protein
LSRGGKVLCSRSIYAGATPLIDCNQNGEIDLDEFATTARSLFAELDKNMDGRLVPNELRLVHLAGTPAAHGNAARQQGTVARVIGPAFPGPNK